MKHSVKFSDSECEQLVSFIKRSQNARVVRHAQALLWIARGESVASVAARHNVSRQTIYNWVEDFKRNRHKPTSQFLANRPRPGRSAWKREVVRKLIEDLIRSDPRELGYATPFWTTPLLHRHLLREGELKVSLSTLRRSLTQIGNSTERRRITPLHSARHFPIAGQNELSILRPGCEIPDAALRISKIGEFSDEIRANTV